MHTLYNFIFDFAHLLHFISESVLIKSVHQNVPKVTKYTEKCALNGHVSKQTRLVHTVHTVHTFCIFCAHLL
jgi:hypothetical protein